jgi:hypothetical protein
VLLADSRSVVPYFNQAILTRAVLATDDPVLDAIDMFFQGAGPHTLLSLWPTPDLAPRRWTLMGHPVVVLRAPGVPPRRTPSTLTVQVAERAEQLAVAERIFFEGFGMDDARGAPPGSALAAGLIGSPLRVRLALLDDEPVAVGIGYVGHGVVNLCGGATLPAARRHGAWETLVWARVADADHLPTVAFTSDDSRPGFLRMGFLPVTRLTLWARHH